MADTLIRGHLDQTLTNYTVAIAKQGGFIGEQVAPPVPVSYESDAYAIFGAEDLRLDNSYYSGRGTIGRTEWTESLGQFLCKEYALEAGIPWQKIRNADAGLRLEMRAAAGLVNKLRLRREKQVADLCAATGTFTQTSALAAGARWDLDTSTPVADTMAGMEVVRSACGLTPNTAVLGPHVWAHLRINPDITQRVAGLVTGTPASLEQAAAALGVDQILVGKAVYNSATEGNTVALADVWGKIAFICYVDPNVGGDVGGTITPAQQFVCNGVAEPFSTFTYEENQTRKHIIQCYDCVDVKVIAATSAYLYTTVVS